MLLAPVVLVVFVVLGCGRGASRSPSAREPRGAAPSAVTVPPATPASRGTTGAVDSVGPAGDTPPARTGTPVADLAADIANMPEWGPSFEPVPLRPDSGPSNVPQLRDAARELDQLADRAGPDGSDGTGARGVLLCRVVIAPGRPWDASGLFSANVEPDVTAFVRFGDSIEARARLPEDAREGAFSVPHVSLREDAPIGLRLVDRDLAVDDAIGEATTTFHPGRPIVVQIGGQATVRCRVLPESVAGPRGAALLASAMRALDSLAVTSRARSATIDVLAGAPVDPPATENARRLVRDAASYLGYGDPDVVQVLERIATAEGAMMRAYGDALDRAVAAAPPPGSMVRISPDVSVVVQTLRCTPGPRPDLSPCELRLDVTHARIPNPPGFALPVDARLLIRDAPKSACIRRMEPGRADDFVRAPGVVTTTFECAWRGNGTPGVGVALAVSHRAQTVLLRAR